MCFSPAASFIAGGALCAAGAYTIKHAKSRARLPFSLIPLIFGIQQIVEGFVWISFGRPLFHAAATYAFVLIAHVFWPTFLPYAVWRLEPSESRKKWLAPFVFVGGVISISLLYFIVRGPVTSAILGRCIAYALPLPDFPFGLWAYVLATCGACLISTRKFVRLFGFAMLGSLGIAYIAYQEAFYSVWCFFAAILSLIVFVHLRIEAETDKNNRHER